MSHCSSSSTPDCRRARSTSATSTSRRSSSAPASSGWSWPARSIRRSAPRWWPKRAATRAPWRFSPSAASGTPSRPAPPNSRSWSPTACKARDWARRCCGRWWSWPASSVSAASTATCSPTTSRCAPSSGAAGSRSSACRATPACCAPSWRCVACSRSSPAAGGSVPQRRPRVAAARGLLALHAHARSRALRSGAALRHPALLQRTGHGASVAANGPPPRHRRGPGGHHLHGHRVGRSSDAR